MCQCRIGNTAEGECRDGERKGCRELAIGGTTGVVQSATFRDERRSTSMMSRFNHGVGRKSYLMMLM